MAQSGGIPGTAVAMATAGAFLLYVGVTGAGIRDGMKALVGGKLPEVKRRPGSAIAAAEQSLGSAAGGSSTVMPSGAVGKNADIAQAAMPYLGVPYRLAGTSKSGIDCSGLTWQAIKAAKGVTPPRTTYTLVAWKRLAPIANSEIAAGDLLFWPRVGPPSHVAIAISGTRVIHAPRPGKVVEIVHISEAFTGGAAPSAMRYIGGA